MDGEDQIPKDLGPAAAVREAAGPVVWADLLGELLGDVDGATTILQRARVLYGKPPPESAELMRWVEESLAELHDARARCFAVRHRGEQSRASLRVEVNGSPHRSQVNVRSVRECRRSALYSSLAHSRPHVRPRGR